MRIIECTIGLTIKSSRNQVSTNLDNINGITKRSVSESLARDEELGHEYLGHETSIYPENSLL